MKKLLAAIAFGALLGGVAHAGEAEIKQAVEGALKGAKVDSVRKAGALGLYEVQVGGEVFYTDEKANYLVMGEIIELKTRRNLTEERKNKLGQIKFSDLPLSLAMKQVRGNGKRVFATFEDPNCGYCKRLARDTASLTDVTIYTFAYPVLGPDSAEKARNILCAADPAKAWNDWMLNGVVPTTAKGEKCEATLAASSALGQKLNVRGTPNIFLSDGTRIPGAIPVAQLEQQLNAIGK